MLSGTYRLAPQDGARPAEDVSYSGVFVKGKEVLSQGAWGLLAFHTFDHTTDQLE